MSKVRDNLCSLSFFPFDDWSCTRGTVDKPDFSLDAKPRTRSVDVPEKKEKEDDWWVRSLVKIDRVRFKLMKVNNLQNLRVGRGQYNRWCTTSIESLQPTIGADAPLITGF